MNIDKANEITKLVNKINKCERFLQSLDGRSYPDEFTICYRGIETCHLEDDAIKLLIDYYKKELEEAKTQLGRL
jgi:hypothetical protein